MPSEHRTEACGHGGISVISTICVLHMQDWSDSVCRATNAGLVNEQHLLDYFQLTDVSSAALVYKFQLDKITRTKMLPSSVTAFNSHTWYTCRLPWPGHDMVYIGFQGCVRDTCLKLIACCIISSKPHFLQNANVWTALDAQRGASVWQEIRMKCSATGATSPSQSLDCMFWQAWMDLFWCKKCISTENFIKHIWMQWRVLFISAATNLQRHTIYASTVHFNSISNFNTVISQKKQINQIEMKHCEFSVTKWKHGIQGNVVYYIEEQWCLGGNFQLA